MLAFSMDLSSLSPQQAAVLGDITAGRNVLVTGPGGTGKSYLLNFLRDWMDGRGRMDVCGATGIAAVNVGGVTLHSWAGIGLGKGSAQMLAMGIRNNPNAFGRIIKTDLLAIDEISMIDAGLLDKLNEVFQLIREDERPFGGLQILLLGDFFQLKPVDGRFAFHAKSWKEADIKVHVLTKVFRQKDVNFAQALLELRTGRLSQDSKDLLNSRYNAEVGTVERPPVYLTTHNADAHAINERYLKLLPGSVTTYMGRDTGSDSGKRVLEKSKIPLELNLKVGSRVICCTNFDPLQGIMNGSAGVVLGHVRFSGILSPQVGFDNGAEATMCKVKKDITLDGKVIASREQFPLRLGNGLTIHSSQGSTLDLVEAHVGKAFERGQIYVCLSRCTTLEGLSIKSLNKAMIAPCPEAEAFYASNACTPDYAALLS